jgi:alpha-N-acetylglucosaminidase
LLGKGFFIGGRWTHVLRRLRFLVVLIAVFGLSSRALAESSLAAEALVRRVLPAYADRFRIEIIPSDGNAAAGNVFELDSRDGKVVLRGDSAVSIASALNWYLKYSCHCQISWCGSNLRLPDPLPLPANVRITSPFVHRVYFNYCTFSYSMAFWDWDRWQQEIDWMALHGINMPLAITGQEAVWQNTLRHYRMSDDEIRAFLCGPAFFAWQYMANLEGYGGPLPQSWIDSHTELARQILRRERELGMTPILQGFTGFVPRALKEKFPDARIAVKPNWCKVFAGTAQLDPLDPLFADMSKTFIDEQTKLFGTDHWYAADPFHESQPPSTAGDYLPAVAKQVLGTMRTADPDAKIAMQTWSLRQPLVENIPADRILLLDLAGTSWKKFDGFWDRPWAAGVLHNYGGRVFMAGDVRFALSNALANLQNPKAGKLTSIGVFPEAILQNPIYYEAATETTWHSKPPDVRRWVDDYILARYGKDSTEAAAAWRLLETSLYAGGSEKGSLESVICARPSLFPDRAAPNASLARHYGPQIPWQAWAHLQAASAELGSSDGYQYDLVDLARQCLADLSIPLQRDVTAAYLSGNSAALAEASRRFLDLGNDLDALLETRREFLLGPWLDDAKRWATSDAERRLYEKNARLQITVWGPPAPDALLFDYSNRQWAGLIRSYYLPRWEKYFAFLAAQPAAPATTRYSEDKLKKSYNRPADNANPFYTDLAKWEQSWSDGTDTFPAQPSGNSVAVAGRLLTKWSPAQRDAYKRFDIQSMKSGDAGDAAIYEPK